MAGCVKFHRHSGCDGLCPRCLTFVLLSNCPCLVHDPLYCFSSGNCLRLKALIQSTDCAVHCCHVHYGYCWYQNYCILNTVPRIGGIVHATSFRIVHSHCPLASLKTENQHYFSLIVQCKNCSSLYSGLLMICTLLCLIVDSLCVFWLSRGRQRCGVIIVNPLGSCRSSSSRPSVRLPCRQHGASCSLCSQLAGSHCQTWSWPRLHGQDDQCCA